MNVGLHARFAAALLLGGMVLTGCGGDADHDVPYAPEDGQGVAQVHISSDDVMRFDPLRFRVRPGQSVHMTLEHVGRMEVERMGHNVVILNADEDPGAFGREVQRRGGSLGNDYVPEPLRDRVIAFTAMIGGGETDTIAFAAPDEPGRYPFVCTFPGHYDVMQGEMLVD